MKTVIAAIILFVTPFSEGFAQEQKLLDVKLLTPAECGAIVKKSDRVYWLKTPLTIGTVTYRRGSSLTNAFSINGFDPFDVVTRSCFKG